MFNTVTLAAAVVAGIVGTIANSIVVSALLGAPLMGLIFSFGREAVAIIVALLLIPIFAQMRGASAWITGIAALTVIPSILAKTVFGAGAPWGVVLGVNAVYAVAAVVTYVLIAKRRLA